jgi:hypothetical protein
MGLAAPNRVGADHDPMAFHDSRLYAEQVPCLSLVDEQRDNEVTAMQPIGGVSEHVTRQEHALQV